MPRRTFKLPDIADGEEPVEFDLEYVKRGRRGALEPVVETFTCVSFLPPAAMRYLALDNALASIGFIDRCLASDEESERFMQLINDRHIRIEEKHLAEILEWLTEVYTGHPTEPPGLSGSGQTPTGESSADG